MNSVICVLTIIVSVFSTKHLTKLSWYNLWQGSYTHYLKQDKVTVYYKTGGNYDTQYTSYEFQLRNEPTEVWRNSNTDPEAGGNPYLVQDVAGYVNIIMDKYNSLGLEVPEEIGVYLDYNMGAKGMINIIGYSAPTGYLIIDILENVDPVDFKQTLAHEYMHYTQDYYMTVALDNYFWCEVNAPLSGYLVWNTILERLEPEDEIKNRLVRFRDDASIFELLSKSWDNEATLPVFEKRINSGNANLSGSFLHYMQTKRAGTKLDIVKLLKEHTLGSNLTTWLWRSYLNEQIVSQLNSTAGAEYDAYVRYLLEGGDDNFTVISKDEGKTPLSHVIMVSKSGQTEDFARRILYGFKEGEGEPQIDTVKMSIPYMASRVVLLQNQSDELATVVRYKASHCAQ